MTDMITKKHVWHASVPAVLALVLAGCSSRTPTTSVDREPPIGVTVVRAAMADIADTFEAGGVVQAQTTATMTARILAPVREVRVAPGDRVKVGQLLIVLDGSDLAAHARSARAAAQAAEQSATAAASEQQAAEAGLVLARATHERIAGLQSKRSATAQELDSVTGALRAAEARVAGAAAQAQAARLNVESARASSEASGTTESFATLTAPFDGVVTDKMVEPGNVATPGTPLMRVEDTRGFRLEVRVDESRIGAIAAGASVPVVLDSGSDGATTTVSGTVAEISRAVDADARAFLVKITLADFSGLRSGMFGRARFSGKARRALTVPARALMQRGQMTSVFVENGAASATAGVQDGRVARLRFVNVTGSEVLAGLAEGELVVVDPPPTLTDGRRIAEGSR
jgi:RND family efflux transporter MFP subunit